MEGNLNDKTLREKLQQAEYGLDPAAWSQMEAMLDRRDRRRGGIWWWLSAAALLVVSSGIAFNIWTVKTGDSATNAAIDAKSQTVLLSKNVASAQIPSKEMNSIISAKKTASETTNTAKLSNNENLPAHKNISSTKTSNRSVQGNNSSFAPSYPTTLNKPIKANNDLNNESIKPLLSKDELINLALLNASEIAMSEEKNGADKISKNEEKIPAKHLKRKTLFHYALGVTGNISEGFIAKTYADQASWSLGLSEEFKIGKYLGLTTGIMYSETHFKVDSPCYPDYAAIHPSTYSSHLQEINIPIGVRVYPYTHRGLSLSLGAAYINHIKLKETFDYVLEKPMNTAVFSPPNYYATDIPFGIQTLDATNPDAYGTTARYSSLANSNRYYGSLQFTAGVNYTIKKHFIFSAEPAFNMSLAKVVEQDARLYSFGLNLGFKYGF